MSGKVCKGVVFNLNAMTTDAMDPENLEIEADFEGVAAYEEFMKGVAKQDGSANWDQVVASCRGWYDKAAWGKPFCCQGMESEPLGISLGQTVVQVYKSESTESADPIEISLMGISSNTIPWAEAFKSATRLGGAAFLSALVFLN